MTWGGRRHPAALSSSPLPACMVSSRLYPLWGYMPDDVSRAKPRSYNTFRHDCSSRLPRDPRALSASVVLPHPPLRFVFVITPPDRPKPRARASYHYATAPGESPRVTRCACGRTVVATSSSSRWYNTLRQFCIRAFVLTPANLKQTVISKATVRTSWPGVSPNP